MDVMQPINEVRQVVGVDCSLSGGAQKSSRRAVVALSRITCWRASSIRSRGLMRCSQLENGYPFVPISLVRRHDLPQVVFNSLNISFRHAIGLRTKRDFLDLEYPWALHYFVQESRFKVMVRSLFSSLGTRKWQNSVTRASAIVDSCFGEGIHLRPFGEVVHGKSGDINFLSRSQGTALRCLW
jgi:hypothetical protein